MKKDTDQIKIQYYMSDKSADAVALNDLLFLGFSNTFVDRE